MSRPKDRIENRILVGLTASQRIDVAVESYKAARWSSLHGMKERQIGAEINSDDACRD